MRIIDLTPDNSKIVDTGPIGPGYESSKSNFGPKSPKKRPIVTNQNKIVIVKTNHNPKEMTDLGLIGPKSSN